MQRIIIVHWSKSTGPEPILQYPPEPKFPSKDLFLKIWALHELDKESSIIEFIPEIGLEQYVSVIQIYESEIYFFIIVYNQNANDQNANVEKIIKESPDILATVSKNLIELVNTNKITRAISEAFQTIKNFSKLKIEENLLNFFKDKIKYTILLILRNGIISKSHLSEILRKDYGFSTLNVDLLLISFIQEKLIVKKSVPGSRECYFLLKDLACTRIPPKHFPDKFDDDAVKNYKEKLINLYTNYDCASESETKSIINFLVDKNVYQLFEKLREDKLAVSECLDILSNREDLFNELLDKEFIYEAKGLVYLLSDVRFIKFTPYYIIKRLSKRYKDQKISFDEYLTHLRLLTEQFDKEPSLIDYEII